MKLADAAFCVDCEEVVPIGTQACPACASRTIVTLARWTQEARDGAQAATTQARDVHACTATLTSMMT